MFLKYTYVFNLNNSIVTHNKIITLKIEMGFSMVHS